MILSGSPIPMINSIKGNWALFVGMLMLMAANGLLVTLLSVRGAAVGMSPSSIGLMQSGYPLGALAGCVYAPRLVARIGHVRAFAALGSLCSITAIVHLLSVDVWTWGAMRMLAGSLLDGNLGARNFIHQLLLAVQMQPRLMVKRVIANLVTGINQLLQPRNVILYFGIPAHDECRQLNVALRAKFENSWNHLFEI